MATEEKPLNSLDLSHDDSSPASNQVHITKFMYVYAKY
jgi:hypothetical protein